MSTRKESGARGGSGGAPTDRSAPLDQQEPMCHGRRRILIDPASEMPKTLRGPGPYRRARPGAGSEAEDPSVRAPWRGLAWSCRRTTPRADQGIEDTKEVRTRPDFREDSFCAGDGTRRFLRYHRDEVREWKRRSGRTTQDLHHKIWYGLHYPLRFVGDSIGLAPRIGVGGGPPHGWMGPPWIASHPCQKI